MDIRAPSRLCIRVRVLRLEALRAARFRQTRHLRTRAANATARLHWQASPLCQATVDATPATRAQAISDLRIALAHGGERCTVRPCSAIAARTEEMRQYVACADCDLRLGVFCVCWPRLLELFAILCASERVGQARPQATIANHRSGNTEGDCVPHSSVSSRMLAWGRFAVVPGLSSYTAGAANLNI